MKKSNKKMILFFMLLLGTRFYTFSFSTEKRMQKEVLSNPDVLKISKMVRQHDWKDRFDVYIEMKDGTKIVFWQVEYEEKKLKFKRCMRIGDYTPHYYCYDLLNKKVIDLGYVYYFPESFSPILSTALRNREIDYFLKNYKTIADVVSKFKIVDDSFYEIYRRNPLDAFTMLNDSLYVTEDQHFIKGFYAELPGGLYAVEWEK